MNYYNQPLGYKQVCSEIPILFPAQHQNIQPAMEYLMNPRPIFDNPNYIGTGKLKDKVAIITGGDSGIGRAVAVAFAKEGANIVIVYYNEHEDAHETKQYIETLNRKCLLLSGDIRNSEFCQKVVNDTVNYFSHIDILVNNAGVAFIKNSIMDISEEQLHNTLSTNIYAYFYMVKAVLPYLTNGSTIINTSSSTAYTGYPYGIDYSSSKGAVVAFTRSLALSLVDKGIRVNAIAPGSTWTPLITSASTKETITTFGATSPMKRAGEPYELAPTYVYLASNDSSYVTGQVLHVDGGLTMQS